MNRFGPFKSLIIAAIFMLSMSFAPLQQVFAASSLIANPSAETTETATKPANWTSNSWGTNTSSFSYANDGNTGSRSLTVTMNSRTNGDAKWMHDAVSVNANTSYTYTTFYKSSIPTEIDLQYTDVNGAVTYEYASYVPASTTWKQQTVTFVTPATAKKVVVMHILADNGTLQTDDSELALTAIAPPNTDGNLVVNPSFETATGANPANWFTNSWGINNATFAYDTTGRTGTKSAEVSITNITSGDAKWFAEPVTVIAGKTYDYKDYYKSNVATRVVAAFTSTSGATTYKELTTAPAAATWTQYTTNFIAPSGVNKVTIFHLLDKVGTLSIDDVNIALTSTPVGLVPNASVETSSGNIPADWTSSKWGTNTASFTYVNDGYTGTKSVRTTVSGYTDGDAKWYFNPISTLTPGKQYRWTTWYKTNTTPRAVAMFNMADGSTKFFGMPSPFPTTGSSTIWTKYSETFQVPQGAVNVTAFLLVNSNGWVQVDDQSITDYTPTGWNSPLLTLTFDDGYEDNVMTALPLLTQYGFKTTQCFDTADIIAGGTEGRNNVLAFYNAGHEICSHTINHPFLTQATSTNLTKELRDSQTYLQQIIGKPIVNFASPYGDYNQNVNTQIKKYYGSHRTVDEGYNSKDNFDAYRLRVQNITPATTAAQVDSWVKQAQVDKTWLVLVYHRVNNNPQAFDTTPALFAQHLEAIKNSGIQVKTMADALATVRAQL